MIETDVIVRRWGRSLGVVIPHEAVTEMDLQEDEKITIRVAKKENPLVKHFGRFKFKKSTAQMLKESDKELWHD